MAELRRTTYNSVRELGEEIIRSDPQYAGMDPEGLGQNAMNHPNFANVRIVEGFSDIDAGETASNLPGDVVRTAEESLSGFGEMLSEPGQTLRGLKNIGLGAADVLTKPTPLGPGRQGVLQQIRGMAEGLGMGDIATPEQEATATEFGSELSRETVSPAGIQERPGLATSNLLLAAPNPLLKALGALGKGGKIAEHVLRAGQLDPIEGIFLGKHAAKKVGEAAVEKVKGTGEKISKSGFVESLRTEGEPLLAEVAAAPLSFTTGTSNQFIQELFSRSGAKGFPKLFRKVRKAKRPEGNRIVHTTALEMTDDLQKKMNDEYGRATSEAFGGPGERVIVSTEHLLDELEEIAEGIGAEFHRVPGVPDDKWTLMFDPLSPVSKSGGSRNVIRREFEDIANLPKQLDAEHLHDIRKRLDDTMSTISDTSPVSRNARQALRDARSQLRQTLEPALGERYVAAMNDYADMVNLRDNLQERFGLHPGKIDKQKRVNPEGLEQIESNLVLSFSDRAGVAGRTDIIEQLEKAVGKEGQLMPGVMGLVARDLMGSGLVVRSELAQMGRLAAGLLTFGGATGLTGFWTLPAVALFSPRIMSETILRGVPAGARGIEKMKSGWQKAGAAMKQMDKLTGGELRKMATREGWDLAMLMERVEQVSDQDFGDEKSIMKSLNNINLYGEGPQAPTKPRQRTTEERIPPRQ